MATDQFLSAVTFVLGIFQKLHKLYLSEMDRGMSATYKLVYQSLELLNSQNEAC